MKIEKFNRIVLIFALLQFTAGLTAGLLHIALKRPIMEETFLVCFICMELTFLLQQITYTAGFEGPFLPRDKSWLFSLVIYAFFFPCVNIFFVWTANLLFKWFPHVNGVVASISDREQIVYSAAALYLFLILAGLILKGIRKKLNFVIQ